MVKQLQEENLSLRQQLLLHGSGRESDNGNPQLLQTKLKRAAHLISRLSKDKQQLIEMGNRLRAQLIESGLDSEFCLKYLYNTEFQYLLKRSLFGL